MSRLKTDEEDIYGALLENDEEAIGLIEERLGGYLRTALQRYFTGLSTEDIEEVYQDTLFRAWETRHRYDEQRASLRTWIFMIAKAIATDKVRRRVRNAEQLAHYAEHLMPELLKRQASWIEEMLNAESREQKIHTIRQSLSVLTPSERQIVITELAILPDELPDSELASLLGFNSLGALHTARSRAYKKIREHVFGRTS